MIGKITIGKSFGHCIAYCLDDKKRKKSDSDFIMKNRATVLKMYNCLGNKKQLISQFNEVKQLNPKLSKPVMHITLSLAPGESLPQNNLIAIAESCAEHFGFENNQYLAVAHKDTDHQHIHIVANRIGFSGKTNVSDSNCYKKVAAFCRKMEKKYELQTVLSPKKFLSIALKELPIPVIEINEQIEEKFEGLLNVLNQSKKEHADTLQIEKQIDKEIFDIYELSQEERELIGFIEIR